MADNQKPQFPRLSFFTPLGRLVLGDPTKASDIGHAGKKKDKAETYVGLAIQKSAHGVNELIGQIINHTIQSYAIAPNIQRMISQGGPAWFPGPFMPEPQRRPFAWKIQDGDWPSNVGKEGHAGCWIFNFSTTQAVNICDANMSPMPHQLVHLGQYAKISGNCAINGLVDANCGIYLNPQWVKIMEDGPIIVTGVTAAQAFAGDTDRGSFVVAGSAPQGAPAAAAYQPAPAQPQAPQQPQGSGFAPPPVLAGFGGTPPAPPPAPVLQAPAKTPEQESAEIAAHFRVQHYPGHRFDQPSNSYKPDPVAGNPPPPPPAPAPAAPVYGTGAPAPGIPQQFQGTVVHSNPPPQTHTGANGYPPVQPHTAFVQGQ